MNREEAIAIGCRWAGRLTAEYIIRDLLAEGVVLPPYLLSDPTEDSAGKVRSDHGDTARAAAYGVRPRSGTQRARVLLEVASRGQVGATDEELQSVLGMDGNTERPRRVELVEGRWIEDSGERRETSTGDLAAVWVLTPIGRHKMADEAS